MDNGNPPKIKWVLSKSLITSSIGFLIIYLFVSINLEYRDVKDERANYLEAEHKTVSQLLFPALEISDTVQIRHLLNLASQNGTTFGIIDKDGDILLPDYEDGYIFKNLINNINNINCGNLSIKNNSIFNNKSYIYCTNLTEKDPISNMTHKYGVIISLSDIKLFSLIRQSSLYLLLTAFVTLLAAVLLILSVLKRKLLNPLTKLEAEISDKILHIDSAGNTLGNIESAPYEIQMIKKAFERLISALQEEYRTHLDKQRKAALFDQATQIAHDIRSPLAAIDMVISDINNFAEEKRIILRSSINRIHDIANDLLLNNNLIPNSEKVKNNCNQDQFIELETVLLSSIINSMGSEKRTQYRSNPYIVIENLISKSAYGIFSKINKREFTRVLSNLINNAVESIHGSNGYIKINLSKNSHYAKIEIEDNGIGIPESILNKIGKEKVTYNKKGGTGHGLYHAFYTIKMMNGIICVDSILNQGTKISISLPLAIPPSWFVPILPTNNYSFFIILDDDITVHQIWDERFKEKKFNANTKFQLQHFTSPNDFEVWLKNDSTNDFLLLCDYEFVGFKETGIDIIKRLNLFSCSILVTSHYDEDHIQRLCEKLSIKLIPKDASAYIPIQPATKIIDMYDAILIDDDNIIRTTWEFYAHSKLKKLKTFSDPSLFISEIYLYNKEIKIYIDSNLHNNQKGEILAQELYHLGFNNLFLTTGYEPSIFSKYTFLKGILNKEPPLDL